RNRLKPADKNVSSTTNVASDWRYGWLRRGRLVRPATGALVSSNGARPMNIFGPHRGAQSRRPSGEKATARGLPLRVSVASSRLVARLQSLSVPSPPADARVRPSGETEKRVAGPAWPARVERVAPVFPSQR